MPQEFQVLQCYQCQTFQVHQVKKSTKWSCKLCGEKQSVKKVFGKGSGYDCRQHVQKLNLLRAEQDSNETMQKEFHNTIDEQHGMNEESEVAYLPVQNAAESRKWSKYVEVDEDKGDNSLEDYNKGATENEMYTTDRNEFNSFRKEIRRSKKRKWQYDSNRGNTENSHAVSLTYKPSFGKNCSNKSPLHLASNYNNQLKEEIHYSQTNHTYEESTDSNLVENEFCDMERSQFTAKDQINQKWLSNDTAAKLLNHETFASVHKNHPNETIKQSKGDQQDLISVDENKAKTTAVVKTIISKGSKWGKFVEENEDSLSEESDNEQNFVKPSETSQSSSLSQEELQNSPACRKYFHNEVDVTMTSKVVTDESNQYKMYPGYFQNFSTRDPLRDIKKNTDVLHKKSTQRSSSSKNTRNCSLIEMHSANLKTKDTLNSQMTNVKNSLFKLDDLNDDDLNFEI